MQAISAALKEGPDATNFPGKRYKASLTRHSLIVTQVGWLALSVSVCLSLRPLQNPKPRDTQRARSGGRGTRHTESECPAQGPPISWCGHPLVLILQFQRQCLSNSSTGQMRMTSSEKGTKRKEESYPYIPYQWRTAFWEVVLGFPASPSELA